MLQNLNGIHKHYNSELKLQSEVYVLLLSTLNQSELVFGSTDRSILTVFMISSLFVVAESGVWAAGGAVLPLVNCSSLYSAQSLHLSHSCVNVYFRINRIGRDRCVSWARDQNLSETLTRITWYSKQHYPAQFGLTVSE